MYLATSHVSQSECLGANSHQHIIVNLCQSHISGSDTIIQLACHLCACTCQPSLKQFHCARHSKTSTQPRFSSSQHDLTSLQHAAYVLLNAALQQNKQALFRIAALLNTILLPLQHAAYVLLNAALQQNKQALFLIAALLNTILLHCSMQRMCF